MKALLALTFTFGAAQANDTTLGGNGVTLLPIKNDNITMADEPIVIDGIPTSNGSVSGWKTHCTFHFKNETAEPQKITMGFPFPRNFEFDGSEFGLSPSDPEFKQLSKSEQARYLQPVIHSFTTKVRGVDVKSKEIKLDDKRTEYNNAWVWEITFAPGETVEVINTYEHGTSGTVQGDQWVDYVLLTGKNWKGGKIGRSLLEVRPHTDFFPDTVEWIEDFKSTPKGARIVEDGAFKKAVWDLKDFAPDSDLHFSFFTGTDLLDKYLSATDFLNEALEEESCDRLRLNRNAYFAWLGYPFKSADLKDHFSKMPWYKENPGFDVSKLSKTNQEVLSKISKIYGALEKKKGCRK